MQTEWLCILKRSVFLSAVTCGLSPVSCVTVVSSLYRTVIFLQGSYTEIKLLLTRLTVVDGLMWRTKISSHTYSKTDSHYRMQVSD